MKENFNEMNHAELMIKRGQLQERYRTLTFDKIMGYIDSPMEIRNVRRNIARINFYVSVLEKNPQDQASEEVSDENEVGK